MLKKLEMYIAIGFPLLPCNSQNKQPLTAHGYKDASLDPKQIAEWLGRYPGCAWGVATSASRAVLDTDPRHGGDASLQALVARHGPLPDCPMVMTGGGGLHYWLAFPAGTRCSAGRIADGIDVRADGGYVIVPPSSIDIPENCGRAYKWFPYMPWEIEIPQAPAWLVELEFASRTTTKATPNASPIQSSNINLWVVQSELDLRTHPGASSGQRQSTLCRLIGAHLGRGDSHDDVWEKAEEWAARCNPPCDDNWRDKVKGLFRKEEAQQIFVASVIQPAPDCVGKEGTNSSLAECQLVPSRPLEGSREGTNSPDACQLVPSFPSTEGDGDEPVSSFLPADGEGTMTNALSICNALALHADALHGLPGEILKALEGRTEAHPPAILASLLTAFGNCVGLKPEWNHGMAHGANMNIMLVGPTTARKGTSWAVGSACQGSRTRMAEPNSLGRLWQWRGLDLCGSG